MREPLVSIITPNYNSRKTIEQTIDSIVKQTYKNWELIVVDDCSTDGSISIVDMRAVHDSRIKIVKLAKNSGPAVARQTGIHNSKGEYVAFCDSDDLWLPDKLMIQIGYMQRYDYGFSCTAYEQINDEGISNGKILHPLGAANYDKVLKTCPIGNSTVVVRKALLDNIEIPNIRKRNDFVLWLALLKIEKYCFGIDEVLAKYRVSSTGISSNKLSLIRYQWHVFRKIEELSILYSSYLVLYWILIKLLKIK